MATLWRWSAASGCWTPPSRRPAPGRLGRPPTPASTTRTRWRRRCARCARPGPLATPPRCWTAASPPTPASTTRTPSPGCWTRYARPGHRPGHRAGQPRRCPRQPRRPVRIWRGEAVGRAARGGYERADRRIDRAPARGGEVLAVLPARRACGAVPVRPGDRRPPRQAMGLGRPRRATSARGDGRPPRGGELGTVTARAASDYSEQDARRLDDDARYGREGAAWRTVEGAPRPGERLGRRVRCGRRRSVWRRLLKVGLDRCSSHEQAIGDLRVGEAFDDQVDYLRFGWCEAGPAVARTAPLASGPLCVRDGVLPCHTAAFCFGCVGRFGPERVTRGCDRAVERSLFVLESPLVAGLFPHSLRRAGEAEAFGPALGLCCPNPDRFEGVGCDEAQVMSGGQRQRVVPAPASWLMCPCMSAAAARVQSPVPGCGR